MIAGTILGAMARPYVAMAVGGALLAAIIFGGVQTWRMHHRGEIIEKMTLQAKEFTSRVETATAKFRAAGLERLVRTQRSQITIQLETAREANQRADRALARYNGLRVKYKDASGRQLEPVRAIPAAAHGFTIDATNPGFWRIGAADGLALLQNADGWVAAYDALAEAWDRQASLQIVLPPPDDGVSNGN